MLQTARGRMRPRPRGGNEDKVARTRPMRHETPSSPLSPDGETRAARQDRTAGAPSSRRERERERCDSAKLAHLASALRRGVCTSDTYVSLELTRKPTPSPKRPGPSPKNPQMRLMPATGAKAQTRSYVRRRPRRDTKTRSLYSATAKLSSPHMQTGAEREVKWPQPPPRRAQLRRLLFKGEDFTRTDVAVAPLDRPVA